MYIMKANQFRLIFLADLEPWLQLALDGLVHVTTKLHVHPSTLWWSMTCLRTTPKPAHRHLELGECTVALEVARPNIVRQAVF